LSNSQPFYVRHADYIIPALMPAVVLLLTVTAWLARTLTPAPALVVDAIALVAIALGGALRFRAGVRDIARRRMTVNVFVLVAIAASLLIGEFLPAAVIIFIMSAAGGLESFTVGKTRKAITSLLDLAPKVATVERDGEQVRVPLDNVKTGDVVIVKSGERIPVDGVVVDGEAAVNQAPVTGEAMPVDKSPGDDVFSGSLSEVGHLKIRTTKVGADTTLARIVHLVEKAQAAKAPIAKIADRFTAYFLPAVLLIAVAVYFATGSLIRSVAVILVACPCALAIATPTAVTAGIANLAKRGVLVKGGAFFEIAGRLQTLVLDKTGTVTLGRPRMTDVLALEEDEEASGVLALAASAERLSEHPIGKAIVEGALADGLALTEPSVHQVEVGHGVVAEVNGSRIVVGNRRLMSKHGIELDAAHRKSLERFEHDGKTALAVAVDGAPAGVIAVADSMREEMRDVVGRLRAAGIDSILLFTGDNDRAAASVAEDMGTDGWRAELLPEQKQEAVRELRSEGRVVGMVGDGINDAPALAEADVGFAMGAAGADVAIETADVSLMGDDLAKVLDTIALSRKVSRRIKINIGLSMLYNAVGITLSSLGVLNPVPAVLYQELGCISVIVSSTLLLWSE